MARDNYNYGAGKMGDNGKQNQMIRDVARQVGVSETALSDLVHEEKSAWYKGDFSYEELTELAESLKKKS